MYFRYHKFILAKPSTPPNFPAWFAAPWSPTPETRQSLLLYPFPQYLKLFVLLYLCGKAVWDNLICLP